MRGWQLESWDLETEAMAAAAGMGWEGRVPAYSPPSLPDSSSSVRPTKAQGSKDRKPKQKVIISDCGEYV